MSDTNRHSKNTGDLRGNTKSLRSRKWCFTLNNWTKEEYDSIIYYLEHKKHTDFIVGKEIGINNTPHLQGFINCKNPISFKSLKNINNRWHLEKSKGSNTENYNYCSKEGNYKTNMKEDRRNKFLNKYKDVIWKDWQNDILNIINSPPEDRKINWVWESKGNIGKSFLSKYLYLKYHTIIADGKKDNIFNQILNFYENNTEEIELVILDIPRHNENYINYGAIEQIKNGLIYSGKYEGGCCYFDSPHIIIFSNFEPDMTKFSQDRYNIINLNKNDILGFQ